MKFIRMSVPDVVLIEPGLFEDSRGFFYESYNQKVFATEGLPSDFVQDNHVRSHRGILRGLHYQIEPMAQGKLIRAVRGEIFDVAVDIRKGSETFGKHVGVTLGEKNRKMLFIPAGFAHGYCSLTDGSEVLYKVTNFYSPRHERGLLWNDPDLGIEWPRLDREYALSERDQKYPRLKDL
ncbi:MAG TPA: dTDP-4-dehydrorhamnose 3,5-epimerase [Candidatus Omnitrophota bacterium]|nr:dTDP-4-dehydrorhamnose 3,5-epimerase [Candidatus Omnitrophota bacterium]